MYENNREDILCGGIEYTFLSLISNKVNVIIIGGGKAGFIKAKTFLKNKCAVSILSKEFVEEFKELEEESITFIQQEYDKSYIDSNHLVIIATDDTILNEKIRKDCDSLYKLYIDCTDFKKGLCVTPCQRSTKNISFGVNTKSASPKTSIYISNKIKSYIEDFDDYIEFTTILRNKLKENEKKNEIMNFICSDDFLFFFQHKKHKEVLSMFYDIDL